MKAISKDLMLAKEKMGLIKEIGPGSLVKAALTGHVLKFLGMGFGKTALLGKEAIGLARGYMLSSPKAQRDVTNFLKAVRSGSKRSMKLFLIKLDDGIREYEKSNQSK